MTTGFLPILFCSTLALSSANDMRAPIPHCCTSDTHSLETLSACSWPELDDLYRHSPPGRPPTGIMRGQAIYDQTQAFSKLRTAGTKALWLGKEFSPEQGMLINRWRLGRAIKAEVYSGQSWLDGGPALVMDYRNTSFVWKNVRDELREIAPGLYLGVMFRCDSSSARFSLFFALQECGQ
jgi:hypothetical protein